MASLLLSQGLQPLFLCAPCSLAAFFLFFPKQFVQRLVKRFADCNTELYGGIIITFLYGADRLSGHAAYLCQIILGKILSGACGLQSQILHTLFLPGLSTPVYHLFDQQLNGDNPKHNQDHQIDNRRHRLSVPDQAAVRGSSNHRYGIQ